MKMILDGIFLIKNEDGYRVVINYHKTDNDIVIDEEGPELRYDPKNPMKNNYRYLIELIEHIFLAYEHLYGTPGRQRSTAIPHSRESPLFFS